MSTVKPRNVNSEHQSCRLHEVKGPDVKQGKRV